MRLLQRIALTFLILFLVGTVLIFFLENQQQLSLSFFSWNTASLPISLYIAVSFLAGMVLGPITGFIVKTVVGRNTRLRKTYR
ncbi:lipopolysaccharide assembly protein LapA domain-containing protein [Pseudomonas sp. PB3P13]